MAMLPMRHALHPRRWGCLLSAPLNRREFLSREKIGRFLCVSAPRNAMGSPFTAPFSPGDAFTSWVDPHDLNLSSDLSELDVARAQSAYAKAIKKISMTYYAGGDVGPGARAAAQRLYSNASLKVLFRPNKLQNLSPFHLVADQAMTFVAGGKIHEDHEASFAITGSKGWSDVDFHNQHVEVTDNIAIAVGNCYLTCAETSGITESDYTIGYMKEMDGNVRMFFHSTSLPIDAEAFDAATVISDQEVIDAQTAWANAIKNISKTYLEGGDYVATAGSAAGELYGYGHTDVLFKPTKAAEAQFRPKAEDAMSYFVGHEAVEGGYAEDSGFAINGGKGWSDVVFENAQTRLTGDTAIAMGNYYFTCAATAVTTKVEYTFGYKKTQDGKLRIFLHHSSVPYSS